MSITRQALLKIVERKLPELADRRYPDAQANDAIARGDLCAMMQSFSGFVLRLLKAGETAQLPGIFELVEECMARGDREVRQAVATCFLDPLQSSLPGGLTTSPLLPYLGPKTCGYGTARDTNGSSGLAAEGGPGAAVSRAGMAGSSGAELYRNAESGEAEAPEKPRLLWWIIGALLLLLIAAASALALAGPEPVALETLPLPLEAQSTLLEGAYEVELDLIALEVRRLLNGRYGPSDVEFYAMPAGSSWDGLRDYYAPRLASSGWERDEELSRLEQHKYQMAAWQRGGLLRKQGLAVVLIPRPSGAPSDYLLLVLSRG